MDVVPKPLVNVSGCPLERPGEALLKARPLERPFVVFGAAFRCGSTCNALSLMVSSCYFISEYNTL
jgi:hypothetical protein